MWHAFMLGSWASVFSSFCLVASTAFSGQIDLNLEVCISNFHVYETVTLAVNVTVNSCASRLQGNHLAAAVRRNQRPTTSPTISSS
jgi:hypothetical protein